MPKNFLVGYQLPAELLLSVLSALLALGLAVVVVLRARGAERRTAAVCAGLAALAVGIPLLLALAGQDYFSSRNVIAALMPALVVAGVGVAAARAGLAAGLALCAVWLVVVAGVAADPRYQRKDWRGAQRALGPVVEDRVLVFSPGFVNPGPFRAYFRRGELMEQPGGDARDRGRRARRGGALHDRNAGAAAHADRAGARRLPARRAPRS